MKGYEIFVTYGWKYILAHDDGVEPENISILWLRKPVFDTCEMCQQMSISFLKRSDYKGCLPTSKCAQQSKPI